MNSKITLPEAFDLGNKPELIAFVGAGGKSSLMMALAGQLSGGVLITTTTRMFEYQIESAAAALSGTICRYPELSALNKTDAHSKIFLVVTPADGEKVSGVPLALPSQLLGLAGIDTVLVEADGAKMQSVKAPAAHEPALPHNATLVVPVIGIDCIGRSIQDTAHRAELLAHLLGKKVVDQLTPHDAAKLLTDQEGGLKSVADGTRVIPVINKVETPEQLKAAREIATLSLQEPRIQQVVISSTNSEEPVLEVHKRVIGIILAAGQSKRMGRSKQQLPWGDTTVLGQTIRNLKQSAVHTVLVVTGHETAAATAIAAAEGVSAVFNPRYAEGEMVSSLQKAITYLEPQDGAVLVMLADQPLVEAETINKIIEAYWQDMSAIIAPEHHGQRGNPVLFDRRHFAEILALPPGSAPRDVIKRHKVTIVPVESPSVLQDIDQPQDYQRHKPAGS